MASRARFVTSLTRNRSVALDPNFWLEVSWLGALIFVPLLFNFRAWLPFFDELKSHALHFFALSTLVLLTWDLTFKYLSSPEARATAGNVNLVAWVRADRTHQVFAAIAVFGFVYVASTVLSPMPSFSLWGISPVSSGYNLYSFLSMVVIFFAVATRVRTPAQAWRIIGAIAAVGTLAAIYAVSQHFGWDPIGLGGDEVRVFSTFGNPIHLGAFIVLSAPATLAVALHPLIAKSRYRLLALAVALGLQLAAMWFSGSRGPFIGLAAGAAVTGVLLLLLENRRAVLNGIAVGAVSLVAAAVLILAPGGNEGGARVLQFGGELAALTASSGGRVAAGLGGRGEIWEAVLELSVTWQRLPPDEGLVRIFRPLFGFGPDMLRFSTPLVGSPRSTLEIFDHAHNRALQVLAEQGWLGFLVFLGLVGLVGLVAVGVFKRARSALRNGRTELGMSLIVVATLGALAGAAMEQMTGVGRVSDMTVSLVLVGLVLAIYGTLGRAAAAQGADARKAGARRSRGIRRGEGLEAGGAFALTISVAVTVAAFLIFFLVDGREFSASRTAVVAFSAPDATSAFNGFEEARKTALRVEGLTLVPAGQLLDDSWVFHEMGDDESAVQSAELARSIYMEYERINPLALKTRLGLAETAASLVEFGAGFYAPEMVGRYLDLSQQFPNETGVLAVTANSLVANGDYELGIEYADRVISLESQAGPSPQAWWVKGEALVRLDRQDEAIVMFETAIEKGSETQYALVAHKALAKIYFARADTAMADKHELAADEVEKLIADKENAD